MSTYVLVHGAWTGSFAFRHVRRGLQQRGHEVFTPSLTGLGERVHLASPQITLTTHVQDVVHCVLYEDLHDVVLLGFSYGGAVVTGALAHIGDRVEHLVYLDAFVPADGDTVAALAGLPAPPVELGAPAFLPPGSRHFDDPDEAAFVTPRRVPQPVATLLEPVRLARPLEQWPFTRTYLRAAVSEGGIGEQHFAAAARHAADSPAWSHQNLDSTHMIASNRPDELVALLAAVVE